MVAPDSKEEFCSQGSEPCIRLPREVVVLSSLERFQAYLGMVVLGILLWVTLMEQED